MLFRIDVYFSEYFLAVKIDEQNHKDREPIFEKKKQEALQKKLVANLLELIQVMHKGVMIQIMKLVKYKYQVSQKKLYMIEMLQNFERVLWNHILVNIPNFKSINAKLKKLC